MVFAGEPDDIRELFFRCGQGEREAQGHQEGGKAQVHEMLEFGGLCEWSNLRGFYSNLNHVLDQGASLLRGAYQASHPLNIR